MPLEYFADFLRRLHDGPAQSAAAVRVAFAVWNQAVEREDGPQARAAVEIVRAEIGILVYEITALQELGRQWREQMAKPAEARGVAPATVPVPPAAREDGYD
ncbi:MAG: hypothetical protein HY332_12370 [Chloroflexi bacterium]|nr:hypothetical protein [Chloroflexota bacterium]